MDKTVVSLFQKEFIPEKLVESNYLNLQDILQYNYTLPNELCYLLNAMLRSIKDKRTKCSFGVNAHLSDIKREMEWGYDGIAGPCNGMYDIFKSYEQMFVENEFCYQLVGTSTSFIIYISW